MIEKMVDRAIQTNSDIVTCGYCIEYKGLSIPVSPMRKQTMDSLSALRALSQNKGINNYPWGKLYAASCFKNVLFPDEKKVLKILIQCLRQSIMRIAYLSCQIVTIIM